MDDSPGLKVVRVDSAVGFGLLSQTPGRSGRWGKYQFVVDDGLRACDYWLPSEIGGAETVFCRGGHAVLIALEPPAIRRYDRRYLAQFSAVVSPDEELIHRKLVVGQPGNPWHAKWTTDGQGPREVVRDFDYFKALDVPAKTKRMSVICSSKTMIEGHRQRIRFVERLKQEFGEALDWFGHGFRPLADKWEALAEYKYHIALENSRSRHYWTEKLADAYLAWSFPIYCGCPNIGEYFPHGSFLPIDRGEPDQALRAIQQLLEEDPFEARIDLLAEARRRVLEQYNFFAVASRVLDGLTPGKPRRVCVLPEECFAGPWLRRLRRRAKATLKQFVAS